MNVTDVHGSELSGLMACPKAFENAMKCGRTPLHWAAVNGHKAVAESLLKAKASIGEFGRCFLSLACVFWPYSRLWTIQF